ncbi:MAG: helix-turn-helix domain-containing protein [Alphaproteobacteria bacterium]|nr:helix-turn-helix domain-containing protein [Alphaproteobacteria bacterium]
MTRQLENRSLDRGISVLEALGGHGACSLHQLHQLTELPKSTLRRLLATLVKRRLVRQGLNDRLYRINIALPMISSAEASPVAAAMVEAASPHMQALTEEVGWPSDLHMKDGATMRVVESTRVLSPFHVHGGRVDLEVNIFGSAGGCAYLMGLDAKNLSQIYKKARKDPVFGPSRFGLTLEKLEHELVLMREAGYGFRRPGYLGESAPDDKLNAIAVPVHQGDNEVLGALTLMWTRNHMEYEGFAERFLDRLQIAADAISADLYPSA